MIYLRFMSLIKTISMIHGTEDKQKSVNVIIVRARVWMMGQMYDVPCTLVPCCVRLTFCIKIPNGPLLFRLHSIYNRINIYVSTTNEAWDSV